MDLFGSHNLFNLYLKQKEKNTCNLLFITLNIKSFEQCTNEKINILKIYNSYFGSLLFKTFPSDLSLFSSLKFILDMIIMKYNRMINYFSMTYVITTSILAHNNVDYDRLFSV